MRRTIWKFLRGDDVGTRLTAIAREVALGNSIPPPIHGLSSGATAINYLANGAAPESAPFGLCSLLPGGFQLRSFTGLNFAHLQPLAHAKSAGTVACNVSVERLCGFLTGGLAGFSILLGGWTDFCLWCWAQHEADPEARVTLILASDNGPLATSRPIDAGVDWGCLEVVDVRRFWSLKTDKSTSRLFREIAARAYGTHEALDQKLRSNPTCLSEFERYVGTKRILVLNVWPWFRIGHTATGRHIHPFNKVSEVHELVASVIAAINPHIVVTLGAWAVGNSIGGLNPAPETWLKRACGSGRILRHSYHPSFRNWNGNDLFIALP